MQQYLKFLFVFKIRIINSELNAILKMISDTPIKCNWQQHILILYFTFLIILGTLFFFIEKYYK